MNGTLAETTFEDALHSFRAFLDSQGESEPILWTFAEDVYCRKNWKFEDEFWIRLPVPPINQTFIKIAYQRAQEKNLGLGISAYARCDDGLCCTLIVPMDMQDAEYLMMSHKSIRYIIVTNPPVAHVVRSRIYWAMFKLLPYFFKRGNHIAYLQSKHQD